MKKILKDTLMVGQWLDSFPRRLTLGKHYDMTTAWELVERGDYAGALGRFQHYTAHRNPRLLGDSDFMYHAFCFWRLGYPMEAVAILRYALVAPYQAAGAGAEPIGLLLYAGERLHDAGVRREAIAALRKHARHTHHAGVGAIVPFLLGTIGEEEFGERILSTVLGERNQCMFDFYTGVRALREGDHDTFAERMRRTVAASEFARKQPEYYLAQWEIETSFPERVRSHRWW